MPVCNGSKVRVQPPNPPKSGAHRSRLSYNVGFIDSFGGSFIALVCRPQVGVPSPQKMRGVYFHLGFV
jgi:hypothetical protein